MGAGVENFGDVKGKISQCDRNVYFNGKVVACVGDVVTCSDHPGPQAIAEGYASVYANGYAKAKFGHKTTCDGNINQGSEDIAVDEGTNTEQGLAMTSSVSVGLLVFDDACFFFSIFGAPRVGSRLGTPIGNKLRTRWTNWINQNTLPPGNLTGRPTKITPNLKPEQVRSLNRENESAQTLANKGNHVEQNPVVPADKNPDYLVNGEVYDCYAPSTVNVRNIASNIADNKVNCGQADRIVLNLSDSKVTLQ